MLARVRRHLKWIIVAVVLIALLFGVNSLRKGSGNGKDSDQTSVVKKRDIESALSLSGTIDADEKVTLQFQTSGKLAWVGIKEGEYVNKYQAIASLDQRALKKDLEKDLLDFMDSRWDFDQLKDDYEGKATTEQNVYITDEISRIVQQSQMGVDKTILDVELSQLSLELSTLITPIEGIVTAIDQPFAGVNITPAGARFQIVNPQTLFLKVIVDQQDITKLKEGMTAEIIFDAFPFQTYKGTVYFLSFIPAAGEESSYLVKLSVPQTISNRLRIGMAAEVNIITDQKDNILTVPFVAVSENNNRSYVNVKDKTGKTTERQVTVGIESDEYVEIRSGLKAGEIVVY